MELRVCVGCRRHVSTRERACPFCAIALAPARGQLVALRGRVTRAAVFSAALAACGEDKPKPPPPAPPMVEPPVADAGVIADAPIDAISIDAAVIVDAAVPVDAGVTRKKKKVDQVGPADVIKPHDPRHLAKPYGAPPARRRIV